jgi:uncharacterized protein YcbK (DUF882 family)
MHRRDLLAGLLVGSLIGQAEAAEIAAGAAAAKSCLDRLWIRRDDPALPEIDIQFRAGGDRATDRAAVRRLSWFWRDTKDHQRAVWIDAGLFDLLSRVQAAAAAVSGARRPLILVSGYRTPERNRTLEGAARGSMHIYGRAADVTVPDFSPAHIAMIAAAVGAGGIGLYAHFTHLDTGRARSWGRVGNSGARSP